MTSVNSVQAHQYAQIEDIERTGLVGAEGADDGTMASRRDTCGRPLFWNEASGAAAGANERQVTVGCLI